MSPPVFQSDRLVISVTMPDRSGVANRVLLDTPKAGIEKVAVADVPLAPVIRLLMSYCDDSNCCTWLLSCPVAVTLAAPDAKLPLAVNSIAAFSMIAPRGICTLRKMKPLLLWLRDVVIEMVPLVSVTVPLLTRSVASSLLVEIWRVTSSTVQP